MELDRFDMGQFIYSESKFIDDLIIEILIDREELLTKLDPMLLVSTRWSLWSDNDQIICTKTLWEYFSQYTSLPILLDETVLKQAISQGVTRNLFAFASGLDQKFERVYSGSIDDNQIEISASTWLLRPEFASQIQMEAKDKNIQQFSRSTSTDDAKYPSIKKDSERLQTRVNGITKLPSFTIDVTLGWKHWDHFFSEVINPLLAENADIKINLRSTASSRDGIKQDIIDLKILEALA
jgi:hypothetical protein